MSIDLLCFQPGMFTAVANHDVQRVKELLSCWFKIDCYKVTCVEFNHIRFYIK